MIGHETGTIYLQAEQAIRAIVADDGRLTPGVETRVHNAIHAARSNGSDRAMVDRLEGLSAILAQMSCAQRSGRPNLYESKRLRLRRMMAA